MQKIVPTVWTNRAAQEAAAHYIGAFREAGCQTAELSTLTDPDPLIGYDPQLAGRTRITYIELADFTVALISAGDEFTPSPALSLAVTASESTVRTLWSALIETGSDGADEASVGGSSQVLVPLGEHGIAPLYGWAADRFGLCWQFTAWDEDMTVIAPSLHFRGTAAAAVERYVGTFNNTHLNALESDEERSRTRPWVIASAFQLEGLQLLAYDTERTVEHSMGVTLHVNCDQTEAARLAGLLTAPVAGEESDHSSPAPDSSAESLEWVTDVFGVTWHFSDGTPEYDR